MTLLLLLLCHWFVMPEQTELPRPTWRTLNQHDRRRAGLVHPHRPKKLSRR